MARHPSLPSPTNLRERRRQRTQRLLAHRAVADSLISVAGLVRRPVANRAGAEVGRLVDVVVRWAGEPYPPATGLVARVGRRLAYIPVDQVESLGTDGVVLGSARLDLRDFERRPGEVVLNGDVVDHQLVDVDGVRVVRASDLYLARVLGVYRLVGVDVGFQTLLRRLGPGRWRRRATPERVIDWAAIQPFGADVGPMRLRRSNHALRRLRPAEVADLLEELGRAERQELLAAVGPEAAADALEEMAADELGALLHESPTSEAAALVARMEPDEAVDALRDLDQERRDELLGAMTPGTATRLRAMLRYPEGSAGGLMTTHLVLASGDETVAALRRRLRVDREHSADTDAVIVVDDDGVAVRDVRLYDLFVADGDRPLSAVARDEEPASVAPDASLDELVERFIDSRAASVLVVDDDGRPLGRILADDVVDALTPERGRVRFPRLVP